MTITPSDLAVGQVWVPKRGTKNRHILSLDPLQYTQGGRKQRYVTREMLVAFLNDDECTLSCETPVPSPIPHPSALGDLYEACKKAADQFAAMLELCPDEVYPNMLSEITTRRDECAAAIRKAGGVA